MNLRYARETILKNIPVLIGGETNFVEHTNPKNFPIIHKELEKMFQEIIEDKNSSRLVLIKKIGKFYWLLSHACFFKRGSAAIADWFLEVLLRVKGINNAKWYDGIDPNWRAILTTEEEFLKYLDKIILNWH